MADFELIEEFSNMYGVPGDEGDVARAMIEATPHDNLMRDGLGSVIMDIKGSSDKPRVAVVGHMDEVGFIVESVEDNGLIRFVPLGGWVACSVPGHEVALKTRTGEIVRGVVGAVAPHSVEDKSKTVPIEEMLVDIGARDREDVYDTFGIREGDPIIPIAEFRYIGETGRCFGKAFDDRLGCCLAVETVRALYGKKHPNTLAVVGSVQEEVGTRGAQTSAYLAEADIAIILEGAPADDIPGGTVDSKNSALGEGVQVRLFDPTAIVHRGLSKFVLGVVEDSGVKHQVAVRKRGGTDARMYHLSNGGTPSIVLSIPVRYPHSHLGVFDTRDYDAALELTEALCSRLDEKTMETIRGYY
ncbi:MAG: M42 family metallopeptidase [bacterium]|nr:M42 family metallopeptidase [bacterium]